MSLKSCYCSSFDRSILWAYDKQGDTIMVDVHAKIDKRAQYIYWLDNLLMGTNWTAIDVSKMVDILA